MVKNMSKHRLIELSDMSISGFWGKRVEGVIQNWAFFVDDDLLLDGFRKRPGIQSFIGEHIGKFLDGAIKANYLVNNEKLGEKIKRLAEELIKCQEEDGYIGTYLPEERWKGRPHWTVTGNNGWDLWVFKYCIIALLSYYKLSGWEPGLEAAKKAADLLIKIFGPGGSHNLNRTDEHFGLASGSVLEAVMLLYQYTNEKRYLDFARHIVTYYWEIDEWMNPRIIPVLRQHGEIKNIGFGKAYEMVSCFVGLLEYYRSTGEKEYLDMLVDARDRMADTMKQVTGNMSEREWFKESGNNSETAEMENCVAFIWIQFNTRLFELTGDIRCLDLVEETAWNHIMAALCPDCSTWSYHMRTTGPKDYSHWSQLDDPNNFKGAPVTCCQTNGLRALSLVAGHFYTIDEEDAISVNLYGASKASVILKNEGIVHIEQVTDFPQSGEILLNVRTENPETVKLKLRLPKWAQSATVDGKKYDKAAGCWIFIEINGYASLKISFEMKLRLILPGFVNRGKYSIGYGPFVFAVDSCPEGWKMDEIALIINTKEFLDKIEVKRENGWPYIDLPVMKIPSGIVDVTDNSFLINAPAGRVRLRPVMFAGIGSNLEYSQLFLNNSSLVYDRSIKTQEYRVMLPCVFM